MNAYPVQLSGGEQQRVAVARALINQPEILLADEPTGNLDPELSEEILKLFLDINLRGTTVVFATHDRELIRRIGRRVLTLDQGLLVGDQDLSAEAPAPSTPGPAAPEEAASPAAAGVETAAAGMRS
jgi:cell division transport system ATP-binding protein